ncbi:MAG: glycosyltransferase [Candidatus Methanomethylicaceae archaeon]
MENEKVSVIIPIWKSFRTLDKCLKCVLKQDYPNFEVLVIYTKNDESAKIAKKYSVHDSRVKLIEVPWRFQAEKRNAGILMSNGKYVLFIDSDQYVPSNLIRKCVEASKKFNVDTIIIPERRADSKGYLVKSLNLIKSISKENIGNIPRFFKRKVFDIVGLQDPKCIYCEDSDFNWRLELAKISRKEIDTTIIHDEEISFKAMFYKPYYTSIGLKALKDKWGDHYDKIIKERKKHIKKRRISIFRFILRHPQYSLGIFIVLIFRAFIRRLSRWIFGITP